jgi:drug/metabolite transporter (DMT)-like permease
MLARLRPRHLNPAQAQGIYAALISAIVLGLAPIFGKQAILAGAAPLTVVALRTVLAVATLWLLFLVVGRRYLAIYPFGLAGCLVAGVINGLGSLMYYAGLGRLDASLAQLLYTLYPLFLTLFSRLGGQAVSRATLVRLGLGLVAVYLLTRHGPLQPDWLGAGLMVGAGFMYAAHLAVNQRVLYDVPAPTVALYTLSAMAATVSAGYLIAGAPALPASNAAWQPILLLTLVTLISRLALFSGIKRLGGVQTAIIGLSELLVTVLAALVLLGEKLTSVQWLGAAILAASILLVLREKDLGNLPGPRPWTLLVNLGPRRPPQAQIPPNEPPSGVDPSTDERAPSPSGRGPG